MIYAIYLWAALWCAIIAWNLPDAPARPLLRFIGSVFLGLIWPVSLPMHLFDLSSTSNG